MAVTPHLWSGFGGDGEFRQRFTENYLAYAERFDLTLVLSNWNTTEAEAERLRGRLELAADRGLDVWLGTYDLREHSDSELVAEESAMAADVERLRRMVDVYTDYYPEGNVFLWHECPLTGQWTGENFLEKAESIAEYGPDIFAPQKRAIAESHPDVDVGLMIHYPVVASPDHTELSIFGPLMEALRERDARPDFSYFDLYRGYHEWGGGYEATNEFLADVVGNLKRHTDGRPVYYLAEDHTIKTGYTPSKLAMLGNLRTALDAGVDAYGWYNRQAFQRTNTERSYDPFVPFEGDVPAGQFSTFAAARDRMGWATQLLLERVRDRDPGDYFDLWVYGHDLDCYECRVSVRADGDWKYVGDVSGYADGDHPNAGAGRDRATVFHGLDAPSRSEGIGVRVECREAGDGGSIDAVYAMPHLDAARRVTDREATDLVESGDIEACAHGAATPERPLAPGETTTLELDLSAPAVPLSDRVLDQPETLARVEERGTRDGFDPTEHADIWVYGDGLDGVSLAAGDRAVDEQVTVSGAGHALVCRGLPRSLFREGSAGRELPLTLTADDDAELRAIYVLPDHGGAAFKSDAAVAETIRRESERAHELETFALGTHCWPEGRTLRAGTEASVSVGLPRRRIFYTRDQLQYVG
jgi:hypothetical protein